MRYYPLPEVARMFSIDPATLWRWLRRAKIVPIRDASDYRRRLISRLDLARLAADHRRVLVDVGPRFIGGRASECSDACERLAELEQVVAQLKQIVDNLCKTGQ